MKKIKVLITIDTEWDRKRNKAEPITVKNLSKIGHFQNLCDKYKIKPVYLCTYEVLNDQNFIKFIENYVLNNKVEIGAHLHPWSNPPFPYGDPLEEQKKQSFPHEYSDDIFYNKLKVLTELIKKKFDITPISYRAGRFGFILEHIPVLSRLGYKVDTSITPHISHKLTKGWKQTGIDFSDYNNLNPNILYYQSHSIIEFPITIIPFNRKYIRTKKIVSEKIIRRCWFRIFPETTISSLVKIIKYAKRNDMNYIVYMMHSNEFDNKNNTYFNTIEKVNKLFNLLEEFFKKFKVLNLESINFKDFINESYNF